LAKEGKVYLRRTEGIRDWFNALKVKYIDNKEINSLFIGEGGGARGGEWEARGGAGVVV
jgi:hypothetical protein